MLKHLQPLPISEEMLGAYLEGNLSIDEIQFVKHAIQADPNISTFVNEITLEEKGVQNFCVEDSPILGEDFELPEIDIPIVTMGFVESPFIDNNENDIINNNMKASHNLETASRIFGEGGNGADPKFDPMINQGPEGVCAIRSQQIILRDYGIDVPLEELKQFAIQNGWYDDGGGTPMGYVGAIIDACGVGVRQDIHCTVYDLVNELAQGHRVIVGVDANELWADRDGNLIAQSKEFIKDIFSEEANHALIVAGVEVNPNDPEDVKVILTDPGTGDLRIEYTLEQFMDAWEDSDCFMTTTTTPAPYQYDEVRGCMVPSNFAVDQFIDANSLPLQADVRIPDGYLASNAYYSEGHLNSISDDVSYDEFSENYSHYKSVLRAPGSFGQDHFDIDDFKSGMKSLFSFLDNDGDDFDDDDNDDNDNDEFDDDDDNQFFN